MTSVQPFLIPCLFTAFLQIAVMVLLKAHIFSLALNAFEVLSQREQFHYQNTPQ